MMVAGLVDVPPAHAACVFSAVGWRITDSAGGQIVDAHGQNTRARLTARQLGSCNENPLTGGGAYLDLEPFASQSAWVRWGWVRLQDSSFQWYAQWGKFGDIQDVITQPFAGSCSMDPGDYGYYKIDLVSGTTDWRLRLKCPGASTYSLLAEFENTGHMDGEPTAESWRFGGTGTRLSDDQTLLEFRNYSDNWNSWPGNECRADTVTDWDGDPPADDHFATNEVLFDPTPTC